MALLASAPGPGAQLYVHVQPWRQDLEGTPVFLESAAGLWLTPLGRDGVAHATGLRPGDYRILLPRGPGKVICRWSPVCGPLRIEKDAVVRAFMVVLRPSTVSSSDIRDPHP